MKRILSFLLVLSLFLSLGSAALAASAKTRVTSHPQSVTIKAGGSVTYSVKAQNSSGMPITWYFENPMTQESTTGKKLDDLFPGVSVKGPNSLSITIKNVPEELHGWTVYCHIGQASSRINSDKAMILIEGKAVPPTYATMNASADVQEAALAAQALGGYLNENGNIVTPVPDPITITGNKVDLYRTDSKDNPVGTAQTELTFEAGVKANFYVKIPDAAEGSLAYVNINGIRLIPEGESRGMAIRNWPESANVKVKVNKPGSGEEEIPVELTLAPQATPAPASGNMVTVTCTFCRFTGGENTYAESGQVPAGTEITVFAVGGNLKTGYTINKAKKAEYKNQASFKLVVEEDTTIVMKKQ